MFEALEYCNTRDYLHSRTWMCHSVSLRFILCFIPQKHTPHGAIAKPNAKELGPM